MSENQKDSEDPDSILARDLENFRLSHPEIEIVELSTVRGTRLRFQEANQAAPFFVTVQPVNRLYCQPYTSPSDLIQMLHQRGLIVEDPDHAAEWIIPISEAIRGIRYGKFQRISAQRSLLAVSRCTARLCLS